MLEFKDEYKVLTDIPEITKDYEVIHFDEYPILYTGHNKYGNRIIGSFANENEEDDTFDYFHIIVTEEEYFNFKSGKKSYLNLIESNKELFVLHKDINNHLISIFQTPLDEIHKNYLPLNTSYYPRIQRSYSLNFAFSLKGKLAEFHKAKVQDINSVSNRIQEFLQVAFEVVSNFNLQPIIYETPSQISSYELNFNIELQEEEQANKLFKRDESELAKFLNEFLLYIAQDLPNERIDFLLLDEQNSDKFQQLQEQYKSILEKDNLSAKNSSVVLTESVNETAYKLSELTDYMSNNDSFSSVIVKNKINGDISSIAHLTSDYRSSVIQKLIPEPLLTIAAPVSQIDSEANEYQILVYAFNTYSGKGKANVYVGETTYHHVSLIIHNTEGKGLSASPFTKSMDEGKIVTVKGVATRSNGNVKRLESNW